MQDKQGIFWRIFLSHILGGLKVICNFAVCESKRALAYVK